jgi:hypothetical protein
MDHCSTVPYIRYTPSAQGLPLLSEGARDFLHRTMALEGSREGKGEAACTYSTVQLTLPVNKVEFPKYAIGNTRSDGKYLAVISQLSYLIV